MIVNVIQNITVQIKYTIFLKLILPKYTSKMLMTKNSCQNT